MIIKGLNFKTKKEEIAYIMANKSMLLDIKKSAIKHADALSFPASVSDVSAIAKALHTSTAADTPDTIKRTLIGNTYNYMDSHNDVHLDSTFTKSLQERGDKVLHLHDHIFQVTAKVGEPTRVYEEQVLWTDLGLNKSGFTTSLMMDSDILKSYNPHVFGQYKDAKIDQHSVGMYYVKVDIAVNDADYPEEHKLYLAHIDKIGNREEVEELGYFWAVQEAKLVEISAVLQGSNPITHTVEAKSEEDQEEITKQKQAADKEAARKEMYLKRLQ